MLLSFYEAGGGQGKIKYLTRCGIKHYLPGQFGPFNMYINHAVSQVKDYAMGNRFRQVLHYGGIISDKQKDRLLASSLFILTEK